MSEGKPHLSEEALLRDALYILQGISGKYVNFVEGNDEGVESSLEFMEDPVSATSLSNASSLIECRNQSSQVQIAHLSTDLPSSATCTSALLHSCALLRVNR